MEARLRARREAAKTTGGPGVGLDDIEYAGDVLPTGLTHPGAEGNPEEQKRAIVNGLTRRATRHGGHASRVAAAIRSVLDEHLPAR
jgi:hypothetical protein